ncbi:Hypothetical predicted protein [Lecanosticta acicola]|uniref:Uncharacterized protein n=1 Tax=Lecanosticta acicola TaxID=111012 RepID=A0AAI8YWD5_9PEZI|nr:Hypothetical predicted protein [Lecanosticta acicola]
MSIQLADPGSTGFLALYEMCFVFPIITPLAFFCALCLVDLVHSHKITIAKNLRKTFRALVDILQALIVLACLYLAIIPTRYSTTVGSGMLGVAYGLIRAILEIVVLSCLAIASVYAVESAASGETPKAIQDMAFLTPFQTIRPYLPQRSLPFGLPFLPSPIIFTPQPMPTLDQVKAAIPAEGIEAQYLTCHFRNQARRDPLAFAVLLKQAGHYQDVSCPRPPPLRVVPRASASPLCHWPGLADTLLIRDVVQAANLDHLELPCDFVEVVRKAPPLALAIVAASEASSEPENKSDDERKHLEDQEEDPSVTSERILRDDELGPVLHPGIVTAMADAIESNET